MIYGGRPLTEDQKNYILEKSKNFKIDPEKILIKQGLTFTNLSDSELEMIKLKEEILNMNELLNKKQSKIDSIVKKQYFGNEIFNEIKSIFPQIKNCLYAEALNTNDSTRSIEIIPIIIIQKNKKLNKSEIQKIHN